MLAKAGVKMGDDFVAVRDLKLGMRIRHNGFVYKVEAIRKRSDGKYDIRLCNAVKNKKTSIIEDGDYYLKGGSFMGLKF